MRDPDAILAVRWSCLLVTFVLVNLSFASALASDIGQSGDAEHAGGQLPHP